MFFIDVNHIFSSSNPPARNQIVLSTEAEYRSAITLVLSHLRVRIAELEALERQASNSSNPLDQAAQRDFGMTPGQVLEMPIRAKHANISELKQLLFFLVSDLGETVLCPGQAREHWMEFKRVAQNLGEYAYSDTAVESLVDTAFRKLRKIEEKQQQSA